MSSIWVRLAAHLYSRPVLKPCTDFRFEYFHFALTIGLRVKVPTMDGTDKKKELRYDRHTVSLLTDHMVFSPKYRGKILIDEVAFLAEAIIRKTCVDFSRGSIENGITFLVRFTNSSYI
jgi:hypothetical protein